MNAVIGIFLWIQVAHGREWRRNGELF